MKRAIKSSELPSGYLTTTRFNSRINDNNVLEAIELAISEKFPQFDAMMDRQLYLTSGTGWTGTVTEYPEGYYIKLEATRSEFVAFVSGDHVIRKPSNLKDPIGEYIVSGDKGHVEFISSKRTPKSSYTRPWSAAEQKRAQEISDMLLSYLRKDDIYDTESEEVYSRELGSDYGVREGTEVAIDKSHVVYAKSYDEDGNRVKRGAKVPGTVHYTVGIGGEILDENVIGYKTLEDAKHALFLELEAMKKANH